MDLLSVFKTENQRELLINVLPGSIASWPYLYLIVHGLNYDVSSVLSEWTIIPIILAFLFTSWGIGFFLTDIASNIELRLEKIYCKLKTTPKVISSTKPFSFFDNLTVFLRLTFGVFLILFNRWEWLLGKFVDERISDKSDDKLHSEFYESWSQYLSICPPNPEPVIFKYYRGVLNRFRFELTLISAVVIMLIGHFLIYMLNNSPNPIDWQQTGVYIGILIPALTFLFIEAFKGVELLDQLRQDIVKICAKK